jgi:hypothetical protein
VRATSRLEYIWDACGICTIPPANIYAVRPQNSPDSTASREVPAVGAMSNPWIRLGRVAAGRAMNHGGSPFWSGTMCQCAPSPTDPESPSSRCTNRLARCWIWAKIRLGTRVPAAQPRHHRICRRSRPHVVAGRLCMRTQEDLQAAP